jgi:hypothetical protein
MAGSCEASFRAASAASAAAAAAEDEASSQSSALLLSRLSSMALGRLGERIDAILQVDPCSAAKSSRRLAASSSALAAGSSSRALERSSLGGAPGL